MQPQDFIDKWRAVELKERSASQSHFNDLCSVLGLQDPISADPKGEWFTFEKGASKTGGGDGWADVWKRGCFAWEYKGKHANLATALKQLKLYQGALENPPLLIVSDMEKIEIHTSWTNMVQETHVFTLDDLLDGRRRALLKKAFSEAEVEAFKPGRKRADLTADVAREFVTLAQSLRERGQPADKVAHFVNRMVFCMFAEDVELLPGGMFKKMLQASLRDPASFQDNARDLFRAMAKQGGKVGYDPIEWFNGGLFDDDGALPLKADDIKLALRAAEQDWSNIEPSIMGTLFERGLDPSKRSQLGAHYTDPEKIMMIVNPVIIDPLTREWEAAKAEIETELAKVTTARSEGAKTQARNRAKAIKTKFLERLRAFRILDPACGSGNFLFLGLKALKDIEHRVNMECEALGLARDFPQVGPENMLGIEINPFAAELARVSVWIGEIQWMREHGFDASRNPILKPLDTIRCHDALLNEDDTEYEWPAADAIIGNPPFLGGKLLRDNLGDATVERMFKAFDGRVPREADLVCYWFAKARELIEGGNTIRAGLVSTNSIRGGANRDVLNTISDTGRIFEAWSDEPWIVDGAAVRVSITCFDGEDAGSLRLNGSAVQRINTDLTATDADLTQAAILAQNANRIFQGIKFGGPFELDSSVAQRMLQLPTNPNGKKNSDVIVQWRNGMDIVRRPETKWCVDFGNRTHDEAMLFEEPYKVLRAAYSTENDKRRKHGQRDLRAGEENTLAKWWIFQRPRPELREASRSLKRVIATTEVSKHRIFVFIGSRDAVSGSVYVIARDDDTTFGILHSRMHELWSLRLGTSLEDRPRYTPSTTFETFPFPAGLTPDIAADQYASDPFAQAIAAAGNKLNGLRDNWLSPPELFQRVPEVVPGYPDRILPKDDTAATILKKRTLTNLYNERPAWLDLAHKELDRAVAAAYGWADWGANGLPDDVILERLFKLNQERAAAGR
jgi:type II restriction/modification system DNA methylase subunit YeeA